MEVPWCTHESASLVISPCERNVWAAMSWTVVEDAVVGSETSCCSSERIDNLVESGVEGESYLARRLIALTPVECSQG